MPRDNRTDTALTALLGDVLATIDPVIDPAQRRYPLAYVWLEEPPIFGVAQVVVWADGPTVDRPSVDPKCRVSHTVTYRVQLARCCAPLADIDQGKVVLPDVDALNRFARDMRRDVDTLLDHLSFHTTWTPAAPPEQPRWSVETLNTQGPCVSATLATTLPWVALRDCYTADGTDIC
jgi:hypothetical protein